VTARCKINSGPSARESCLLRPLRPAQLADLSNISGLSFVAEQTNFKNALIQQFNLQVEQQVGANVFIIGYVGNIGQHLPESINNINQPLPFNPITNAGASARALLADRFKI